MTNVLKQNLLNKVNAMKTATIAKCSSCGTTPDASGKTGQQKAVEAYNYSFGRLVTAINNYYNGTSNTFFSSFSLSKWQQNLYHIIEMDFIREMTKGYVYDPPSVDYPTEDLPLGESDYLDLFGLNGMYDTIMNYDDLHYWNGDRCCVGQADNIEADVALINNAAVADLQNQEKFLNWLRYYPEKNQLITITENQQVTEYPTVDKEVIGRKIYIDKHAKSIIESFEFDIYIPSYL